MRIHHCILLPVFVGLVACSNDSAIDGKSSAVWVKTIPIEVNEHTSTQGFSGTIQARKEIPIAFQVPGRISQRLVDAGQTVTAGTTLFTLDDRDIRQNLNAAEAALAANKALHDIAKADLERYRRLITQKTISQQQFENIELQERVANTKVQAAEAQANQARIQMDHTQLQAKTQGILINVTGEPGQVVNPGQTIAVLADTDELEVEIFLPDGLLPPKQAEVQAADGKTLTITLREVAGAADPASRTWRVRYGLDDKKAQLPLGSIVKASLEPTGTNANVYNVPLGALDERGTGPHIWHIVDGKATQVPVKVLSLDQETARIETTLPAQGRIISLGTHLLQSGMLVRDKSVVEQKVTEKTTVEKTTVEKAQ